MEFEKIIELIKAVSNSSLTQFELEQEDIRLAMKTNKKQEHEIISQENRCHPIESGEVSKIQVISEETSIEGNIVKAPFVGTFYNAPSPDSELFVQVGDKVQKGQTLGIVEAMKLMNEIESEFDGVVEQILVENEGLVEYGQPLFVIK